VICAIEGAQIIALSTIAMSLTEQRSMIRSRENVRQLAQQAIAAV